MKKEKKKKKKKDQKRKEKMKRYTVKGNILVGKNPRVFSIFSKSARIFPRESISLPAYIFIQPFF